MPQPQVRLRYVRGWFRLGRNDTLTAIIRDGSSSGVAGGWQLCSREQDERRRGAFFIAWDREACEVDGRGSDTGRHGRGGYVGAGLSALAVVRKTATSGQAEAKATRMRAVLSMTRGAHTTDRGHVVLQGYVRNDVDAVCQSADDGRIARLQTFHQIHAEPFALLGGRACANYGDHVLHIRYQLTLGV